MIHHGYELYFLKEIKRYADAGKKIQAKVVSTRFKSSSNFKKSK